MKWKVGLCRDLVICSFIQRLELTVASGEERNGHVENKVDTDIFCWGRGGGGATNSIRSIPPFQP